MRIIQRIPRTLARAASAGAVVIAAALPLAVATAAGAATPATLLATTTSLQAATTATATASFAQGAFYATGVTPGGSFAFAAGTAYPVTDTTVAGRLASGTTLTKVAPANLASVNVSRVAASGSNFVLTTAALGAAVYAGEALTVTDTAGTLAASVGGTSVTVVTNAASGATSITVSGALTAGTDATTTVASAATPTAVYDFNQATIGAGSGDTLSLTTGYNESPSGYVTLGQGSTGTIYIYGKGFAFNGGNTSVASTATGVTFTSASETVLDSANGFGYVSATYSVGATTSPNFYNLTVTDSAGTTAALTPAFVVTAAPAVTAVSPTTITTNPGFTPTTVTLTGSGFQNGMTASFTSTSDGTTLVSGAVTNVTSTSATVSVSPENKATSSAPTGGTYAVTVTNTDGGTSTSAGLLTISGPSISSVSPSYLAIPAAGAASVTTNVTITGTNLQNLAVVSLGGSPTLPTVGIPTYTSTTSITVPVTVSAGNNIQAVSITVQNPGTGGSATLAGALGIGTASTATGNAATITAATSFAVSPNTTGNLILTGTGFVPGANPNIAFYPGTSTTASDTGITCSAYSVVSTTQLSCTVSVSNGSTSASPTVFGGPVSVSVNFGGSASTVSNEFPNALTVTGPQVTSVSPANYVASALMGTVTITGSGFTNAPYSFASTGTTGTAVVQYVSPTELQVTGLSTGASTGTTFTMTLTQGGVSAQGTFAIGASLGALGVSYASSTISTIGVGATNAVVTVTGSGFLPGATVSFTSPLITDTVTNITPGSISLKVSVASTAVATGLTGATSGAFTVTNVNGSAGTGTVTISAAPGGTLSQSSVIAGATAATINVTGGNFSSATTVKSSTPLLTLGTPSYSSATGTYSFTASAPAITGTTAVGLTLTFVNPDGGTSTAAFSVNPQPTVTGTYYVPTFSTNYEVAVSGTGFESGIAATSSNSAYSVLVAGVNTTGTVVTLLVTTTSAATAGTSSNITLTNLDGSTVTFALNGGPAPVAKTPAAFKVFRVFGVAFVGRTVTIKISGTGFYGQPKVTSNVGGVKAIVSGDTGKVLTVRVTASATTPRGVHTFTVRLANGKSGTVRYNQK